ncbi:MAG TPA: GldG family protein [Mobilitalea sp.]|nr:GldG family protein [Mobilitalea sp.]
MNELMNQDNENQNNENQNNENHDKDKKDSLLSKIKASFTGRKFRSGAYVSIISTIVIIIVIVVNLIVSKVDLRIDISTQNLYTLTKNSVDLVNNIQDDITIYYLVETGNEVTYFQKIAEEYDSLSEHINMVEKDPILYPKFASQYVEDAIVTNSFLVINNTTGRAKYVDNSTMLVQEINYETFQPETTGIDVEGRLTSAIQYVTNPDVPVLYSTTGHAEKEIGPLFQETLEKQNVEINMVSTLTENIPEDCDILFINVPQVDFTEDEISMIKMYMEAGGNAVIITDYNSTSKVNFKSLLEYYGMQMVEGVVWEGDTNRHIPNVPYQVVPNILSHDITQKAIDSKRYAFLPVSSGLTIIDNTRSSLAIEPLLVTSEKAYSKVNLNAVTIEKEEGDIDGPFYLGLLSSDTYQGVTSNMVVYSTSMMFDDSTLLDYANIQILTGTVNYLSDDAAAVSVPTRTLIPEGVTLTQHQAIFWGAIVVILLPALILFVGIVISLKRRKR